MLLNPEQTHLLLLNQADPTSHDVESQVKKQYISTVSYILFSSPLKSSSFVFVFVLLSFVFVFVFVQVCSQHLLDRMIPLPNDSLTATHFLTNSISDVARVAAPTSLDVLHACLAMIVHKIFIVWSAHSPQ